MPWQPPAPLQRSECVHSCPSSQVTLLPGKDSAHRGEPSQTRDAPHTPTASLQVSVVPVHRPCASQVSVWVHSSPSSHAVPTGAGGCPHVPAPSQTSAVQAAPSSLQGAPGAANGYVHSPEVGSHWPAGEKHSPGGLSQTTPAWPRHIPLTQASPVVHALPSSHGAVTGCAEHSPVLASHVFWVQTLPSSQSWSVAHAAHRPAAHRPVNTFR